LRRQLAVHLRVSHDHSALCRAARSLRPRFAASVRGPQLTSAVCRIQRASARFCSFSRASALFNALPQIHALFRTFPPEFNALARISTLVRLLPPAAEPHAQRSLYRPAFDFPLLQAGEGHSGCCSRFTGSFYIKFIICDVCSRNNCVTTTISAFLSTVGRIAA
jgi:hypothetical protein